MPDIEVAGSVFAAEVGGVEHVAAGYAGAFVRIPVHGVRVGVVGMQTHAVVSVAGEPDEGCFIRRVGAAHDFGDLLVIRIQAARGSRA